MKQKVTLTWDEKLVLLIDKKRGLVSRSAYTENALKGALK
jgi:hypothetical protein